jgi:2,4-dienoyl-CoA reductase-like NADH-dependent reductase (Old Yellow Enzyme family)
VISAEEIDQFILDFAAAAARAKAAGVDCVELHCAHGTGMLHSSAMSPFHNSRTDKYGGNWENRPRFTVETVKKVREAVGEDYPVLVRINGDDLWGERGVVLEDTCNIVVPALEEAGVDCIDVSQGDPTYAFQGSLIPLYYPRGCWIHIAAKPGHASAGCFGALLQTYDPRLGY